MYLKLIVHFHELNELALTIAAALLETISWGGETLITLALGRWLQSCQMLPVVSHKLGISEEVYRHVPYI